MKLIVTLILIVAGVVIYAVYSKIHERKVNGDLTAAGMVTLYSVAEKGYYTVPRIIKSDSEWKKLITPEQYKITVKKGTERPFTNKYYGIKEKGIYKCIRCGTDLFSSEQKYDSGSGWPSFMAPVSEKNITYFKHVTLFGTRTQVLCARCNAYLGEVFDDGPPPTHKRYCMDSPAFNFVAKWK